MFVFTNTNVDDPDFWELWTTASVSRNPLAADDNTSTSGNDEYYMEKLPRAHLDEKDIKAQEFA